MVIIIFFVAASLLTAYLLPVFYAQTLSTIQKSIEAESQKKITLIPKPLAAVVIQLAGVLPLTYIGASKALVFYVMVLGIAAYIDYVAKWVPDIVIYALLWISLLGGLNEGLSPVPVIINLMIVIMPLVIINLAQRIYNGHWAFASGDLYALPTVTIWLSPEVSIYIATATLAVSLVLGRVVKEIPFITLYYFAFIAGVLCDHLL